MTEDTVLTDLRAKFHALLSLREKKDRTKAAAEKAAEDYRIAQAELYRELEEAGSRGTFTFEFGDLGEAKFGRRATAFGRVIDKEAALESLKREGLDEIILQESVSEGRLNALVRERLEQGKELPEGIDCYHRKIITVARKNKKKPSTDALDV